jgi:hypothetical protein
MSDKPEDTEIKKEPEIEKKLEITEMEYLLLIMEDLREMVKQIHGKIVYGINPFFYE